MIKHNRIYAYHRLSCASLQWQPVADDLWRNGRQGIEGAGGHLYGVWRSQIGRPRDELGVITSWAAVDNAQSGMAGIFCNLSGVRAHETCYMQPTLRPTSPDRPTRQGNYAFRSFEVKSEHWDEFLALSEQYWPDFEVSYDSQIIGLWRLVENNSTINETAGAGGIVRSLLLTRRPNLAMWERSKMPQTEQEAKARQAMIRRYDICDSTEVFTTTLLSADDEQDTVRWT